MSPAHQTHSNIRRIDVMQSKCTFVNGFTFIFLVCLLCMHVSHRKCGALLFAKCLSFVLRLFWFVLDEYGSGDRRWMCERYLSSCVGFQSVWNSSLLRGFHHWAFSESLTKYCHNGWDFFGAPNYTARVCVCVCIGCTRVYDWHYFKYKIMSSSLSFR